MLAGFIDGFALRFKLTESGWSAYFSVTDTIDNTHVLRKLDADEAFPMLSVAENIANILIADIIKANHSKD